MASSVGNLLPSGCVFPLEEAFLTACLLPILTSIPGLESFPERLAVAEGEILDAQPILLFFLLILHGHKKDTRYALHAVAL